MLHVFNTIPNGEEVIFDIFAASLAQLSHRLKVSYCDMSSFGVHNVFL